jgi:hypothetical protein
LVALVALVVPPADPDGSAGGFRFLEIDPTRRFTAGDESKLDVDDFLRFRLVLALAMDP